MKAKIGSLLLIIGVLNFVSLMAKAEMVNSPFDYYYPQYTPSFQSDQIKYAKDPSQFANTNVWGTQTSIADSAQDQQASRARTSQAKTNIAKAPQTRVATTPAKVARTRPAEDSVQKINLNGVPLWGTSERGRAWTQMSLQQIRKYWSELNRSRDVSKFCPRYSSAGRSAQEACWLLIFSALAEKESDFNQGKSFPEGDGKYSVGLFALSPGECRNAPGFNDLKNGVENLRCGIRKFAELTNRFGMISNGRQGASAYWSTLRPPYRAQGYNLGKLHQITARTQARFARAMSEEGRIQRTATDSGQSGVN